MKNSVEIKNLCKNYDQFSLKDVSFNVPTGYIMGFIGQNGAGKTTTIKSILNMLRHDSGEIVMFGQDTKNSDLSQNDSVGVVLDNPFFVEDWNANDVESAVSLFYKKWDKEKFDGLLKKFKIDRKKKIKELSRGMKVKIMVSVALSHDAKLLMLDEPTSGLDPVARDELCELLADFVIDEDKSVLFSTHITSDLEKIADYITFILDGQIVFTGTKEDLLEKYVSVKGGISDVDLEQKNMIIGFREHQTGFDGMIDLENMKNLPQNLLFEPVSLDEIIVYMNREGEKNE